MNIKSILVLSTSLLAISVRADKVAGGIAQLSLSSDDSENLFRASVLIERFSAENGLKNQIRFDLEKSTVQLQQQGVGLKLDELIGRLNAEFGESVKIEKVEIDSLTHGTQDGWM